MSSIAATVPVSVPSSKSSAMTERLLVIFGISLFVACYHWAYVSWLQPVFAYFGFQNVDPPMKYLALASVLSVLPSLWMPIRISRPSHFAYWFLYLTVLIPSTIVPVYMGLDDVSRVVPLILALFSGFATIGLTYRLPLHEVKFPGLSRRTFGWGFGVISIFLAVCVVVGYRDNFRIVTFADIADVRIGAEDVMSKNLMNYPLMWLYGAVNPFLMGFGLYHRRIWLYVLGILGQVLVYGSLGNRASLLSAVLILGFYILSRKKDTPFGIKFTWGLVALFLILCIADIFQDTAEGMLYFVPWSLSYLMFFRTFGLPGLLTTQYLHFFQANPLTYYSHLKGVSWFIHYPYAQLLGTEIGYFYYYPLVDTTAHFWATDGLAALGIPGIIVASVFCGVLFWAVDSVSQRHDPRLAGLVICYSAYNLANLSMFTTLLSGGLGLLMLSLYLLPRTPVTSENDRVYTSA